MEQLKTKQPASFRIVTWNAASGFQNKFDRLRDELEPDLAIVQEACNEGRIRKAGIDSFSSYEWIGRYPTKGLSVIGFGNAKASMYTAEWDQRLEWVLPAKVMGPASFNAFGCWIMNRRCNQDIDPDVDLTQGAKLVDAYADLLTTPTVIAGDFNNGKYFEKGTPRDWSHVVARYEDLGLTSAYHEFFGLEQGDERHATHWWTRSPEKAFHIDHCFVPHGWDITQVWVGRHEDWLRKGDGSDHAPMVIDVAIPPTEERADAINR